MKLQLRISNDTKSKRKLMKMKKVVAIKSYKTKRRTRIIKRL